MKLELKDGRPNKRKSEVIKEGRRKDRRNKIAVRKMEHLKSWKVNMLEKLERQNSYVSLGVKTDPSCEFNCLGEQRV